MAVSKFSYICNIRLVHFYIMSKQSSSAQIIYTLVFSKTTFIRLFHGYHARFITVKQTIVGLKTKNNVMR